MMFPYILLAAGLMSDFVMQPPWDKPWTTTQQVEAHGTIQNVMMMPTGRVHILITCRDATAVLPLETCVALTMGQVPIAGQIGRKDGNCQINFTVQTAPTPYIVGLRNDDYVDHTYLISYSHD